MKTLIILLLLTGTAYAGMTFTGMVWEKQDVTENIIFDAENVIFAGEQLIY